MPEPTPPHLQSFPDDLDSTETLRTQDLARRRSVIDSREGQVGPYRLLETIGEGGFGTVYLAEQVEPIRRRVALKIIKAGMDTKQVIARFEAERQALAMMNHPNVAKVLDAGATDKGRPYFVMEHVPGVRITEHCDRHRLDVKQRLDLFLQVCEAIQHAHQKGIIHRDIKPSNILVSVKEGKALPKVIDFGVAKATAGRLTDKTVYTEQGQFIGTPAYMSPEQAEMTAQDIDTRSDIYSLGVLLYELLTGTVPFDQRTLGRADYAEVQRILRHIEPPRPSTRVGSASRTAASSGPADGGEIEGPHSGPYTKSSIVEVAGNRRTDPPALRKQLRGDLDWITMKAMEKDRTRRYASASDFAADIMRHLRDEPVLAGPPSATYRMKKFIRRNRVGVAVALTVLLSLTAGLTGTVSMYARATRQRDRAERIASFMADILAGAKPSVAQGRDTTMLREMLDASAKRIDGGELANAPEAELQLRRTIGSAYLALGSYERALSTLEPTVSLVNGLYGPKHPQVAETLHLLGRALESAQRPDAAERAYRQALAINEQLFGPEHLSVADSLYRLASVVTFRRRYDEAEPLFRRALAIQRKNLGEENLKVASTLNNLGTLFEVKGDLDEAEGLYRQSLEILNRLPGEAHPGVSSAVINLGDICFKKGDWDQAERIYREVLALERKSLGEDHPIVALYLLNLAGALAEKGGYEEAEALCQQAENIQRARLPVTHRLHYLPMNILGAVRKSQGRYPEAEELLLKSYEAWRDDPSSNAHHLHLGLWRLLRLYESWDAAEPGKGYAEKAAEWRAKLEETSKSQNVETPK